MIVSSAVATVFRETVMFTSLHAKATARNANSASHGPNMLAKKRTKGTEMANPKDIPNVPRVQKVRGKNSKTGSETSSETLEFAQTYHTDNSWLCDGRSYDWCSVGTHEVGNKPVAIPQVNFLWEVFPQCKEQSEAGLNG